MLRNRLKTKDSKTEMIVLTYKARNELTPSYICSILQSYHPVRTLGSVCSNLLLVPLARLKAFVHTVEPTPRQTLQLVSCFKSKAHLFLLLHVLNF